MSATVPSPYQLFVMALFGMLTTGFAYILVLTGSRYLSSGEAGFLSMLDVVLGPLWVWMFFAEQPGVPVLKPRARLRALVSRCRVACACDRTGRPLNTG